MAPSTQAGLSQPVRRSGRKAAVPGSPATLPAASPARRAPKRKASQLDLTADSATPGSPSLQNGPVSAQLQLQERNVSASTSRINARFVGPKPSLIAALRLPRVSSASFLAPHTNGTAPYVALASAVLNPTPNNGTSNTVPAAQVELKTAQIAAATPNKKRKTTRASLKSRLNPSPSPVDTRPLPWGDPQVWAETRTDLCESLPYFKQNQGATSYRNGIVRGMLQDHDGGERSLLEEEVVITRCSGGLGTDDNGETRQVSDQDANAASIACFSNSMHSKQPLMLILGSNNKQCPAKVPHRYCVMAPFHVTDVWDEKSYGKIAVKVRLEKTDLQHKSWWAAENSGSSPGTREVTKVIAQRSTCVICHQERPQIYVEGWVCLNRDCTSFWILDGREIPHGFKLTYNPVFLAERTIFNGFLPPFLSVPKPIQATGQHDRLFSVTRQCWRGIVCTKCGRCNSRRDWDAWRCRTEGCDFEWELPREIIPASAVMGDLGFGFQGHAICDDEVLDSRIKVTVEQIGFWRVVRYEIMPGVFVSHFLANDVINKKPGGADDIFGTLQEGRLRLERQVMKSSVVPGQLTRHFSANIGLPYKYIVGQKESTSFSDAPGVFTEAIRRMTWAAKHVVGDGLQEFNELLAVGYFEGSKMGYHDDGEDTLGSTVTSWSFGGPSAFNFRVKDEFFSGFKAAGHKNYDSALPVIGLCYKPEVRKAINQNANGMSQAKLDKVAKDALSGCKKSPTFLKMKLRHGDFMVMHGAEMQKYTEHESVPTDMLRFALTARHVKPDMITQDQHHKGVLDLDPMDPYDGDLELYEEFKRQQARELEAASARRRGASDAIMA